MPGPITGLALGTDAPATAAPLAPAPHRRLRQVAAAAGWALVGVAISAYMGFRIPVHPIVPGADPSAFWAVNYAAMHGLRFGEDIVFSRGPYIYLVEAVAVPGVLARRVAWTFVLVLGCGIAVAAFVRAALPHRAWARLGSLLLLLYAIHVQPPEYQWLGLVLVLALVGLHSEGSASTALVAAGLLSGFLSLVKLSLGVAAVLAVAVVSLCGPRRWWGGRLAIALGSSLAGVVSAWVAHSGTLGGLAAYVTTGWQLLDGYGSAVSKAPERWWIAGLAIAIFAALVAAWAAVLPDRARRSTLALALPFAVVVRHALVRQDTHVRLIVIFGLFVVAILAIEAAAVRPLPRTLVAMALLPLPLLVVWFRPESSGTPAQQRATLQAKLIAPFRHELVRQLRTVADVPAEERSLAEKSRQALAPLLLPPSVRAAIGSATTDAYPWELSYFTANDLSWATRPGPQSFCGYTPALDARDAAFYSSERRPTFLLWHAGVNGMHSVDGRHLLWDEPKTVQVLMTEYELVDEDEDFLLLRAAERSRLGAPERIGNAAARWGEWLDVPADAGMVLAEVRFRRRPLMALKRKLFREDPVYIGVRFATGEEARFRVVPDQLGSGLWISPLPVTLAELGDLWRGEPVRPVVAIRLDSSPSARLASTFDVAWSRLPRR